MLVVLNFECTWFLEALISFILSVMVSEAFRTGLFNRLERLVNVKWQRNRCFKFSIKPILWFLISLEVHEVFLSYLLICVRYHDLHSRRCTILVNTQWKISWL